MMYDIIVPEPSMSFYMIYDHITITVIYVINMECYTNP